MANSTTAEKGLPPHTLSAPLWAIADTKLCSTYMERLFSHLLRTNYRFITRSGGGGKGTKYGTIVSWRRRCMKVDGRDKGLCQVQRSSEKSSKHHKHTDRNNSCTIKVVTTLMSGVVVPVPRYIRTRHLPRYNRDSLHAHCATQVVWLSSRAL